MVESGIRGVPADLYWVAAALIYSFLVAGSNVVDKYVFTRWVNGATVPTLVTACLSLLCGGVLLYSQDLAALSYTTLIFALLAGALGLLAYVPYYWAEQGDTLSRVIPFFYFTPLFTALLSFLFLDELLAAHHYLAAVLLVIGAIAVSVEDGLEIRLGRPQIYMLLSALISSILIVIAKVALDSAPPLLVFAGMRVGFVLCALPYFLLFRGTVMQQLRATPRPGIYGMALSEGLVILAHLIFLYGLNWGSATLLNAVSSTNAFFVLALTFLLRRIVPGIYKDVTSTSQGLLKVCGCLLMFLGCIVAGS